jgi:hypothetical protein
MHQRVALLLLLVVTLTSAQAANARDRRDKKDMVPDEKTAVKIAEAILTARFGENSVKVQLPLRGNNSYGEMWIVQGTQSGPSHTGGGMAVRINKHSGCIVNVLEHMK